MKRATHLLLGAAVATPIAVALDPLPALGCLWLGTVGGALPDYLDLRSDARRVLRHRGTSHSLFALAACTAAIYVLLDAVSRANSDLLPISTDLVAPWTTAFAFGFLSHLASDACTRGGIQPFLPLSRRRVWLLPRFLRSRSDGFLNVVACAGAAAIIVAGAMIYLVSQISN